MTAHRPTTSHTDLTLVSVITLDLDDTLWPVRPPLVAAEKALADWLATHAPATARGADTATMARLRAQVGVDHPHWAHDLSAMRLEAIRRALRLHGDDPALAEAAFEAFIHGRHQVTTYDDVLSGLERLAARYRLVALTNGNADIGRVGLGRFFTGAVSARLHGAAKPTASIFLAACDLMNVPPRQVLHLGDDLALDVQGALDAGLQAGWIHRPDGIHAGRTAPAGAHEFADLAAVADALGA